MSDAISCKRLTGKWFAVTIYGKRYQCASLAEAQTAIAHYFGERHPQKDCIVCQTLLPDDAKRYGYQLREASA